ncbi:MAG TPA: DUF6065 family protein, partial [Terricaulis sp.]|nr:DUF6065 family protein [Terricaulis sp.]
QCAPIVKPLSADPAFEAETKAWVEGRSAFIARVRGGDKEAQQQVWQRTYFAGKTARGEAAAEDHIHRRRLPAPRPAREDE